MSMENGEPMGEHSLELVGPLDVRTTREVRAALHALLEVPGRVVVVDLRRVTSADVVALRVLAAATRYAAARGSRVVLRSVPAPVRRLLAISRLSRVVEIVPDGDAARVPTPRVASAGREGPGAVGEGPGVVIATPETR